MTQLAHPLTIGSKSKTLGKVENALPTGDIDAEMRLVLVDTIYFKARWNHEFLKGFTETSAFHSIDSAKISVPMMNSQNIFSYSETDQEQVLDLPYLFEKTSMIVILPKKIGGLPDLEKTLSVAKIEQWLSGRKDIDVKVSLPKFRLASTFGLKPKLEDMGMKDAFSRSADFSGIDGANDLSISGAVHKAFVEVDEEGTEATAASVISATKGGHGLSSTPVLFNADHPFLFFIRHNETGAILFIGRVEVPEST
jgi:serpin B